MRYCKNSLGAHIFIWRYIYSIIGCMHISSCDVNQRLWPVCATYSHWNHQFHLFCTVAASPSRFSLGFYVLFRCTAHSSVGRTVMWLRTHVCPSVGVSSSLILLSEKWAARLLVKPNCNEWVSERVSVCNCTYPCSFGLLTFSAKSNNDRAL